MSRYCIKGRWFYCTPNSKIRYESSSEYEDDKYVKPGKPGSKLEQVELEPVKEKVQKPSAEVNKNSKPKIRKTLNL